MARHGINQASMSFQIKGVLILLARSFACYRISSKMRSSIHAFVQNPNDGDAITGRTIEGNVMPDVRTTKVRSENRTVVSGIWVLCERLKSVFQLCRVVVSLV